jgi:secondary thiamine-phosphate synthase enzyme
MQKIITLKTNRKEGLYDITQKVNQFLAQAPKDEGLVNVYVLGATSAIIIQENWDESVQRDILKFLRGQIPDGVWEHDKQDNNASAHIKAGILGPSETIPIIDGKLGLSTWQNLFLADFDGPHRERRLVITII